MIQLKERIKTLMDISGMSVTEFSKHIGLKSPNAIREILNGRTKTLSDAMGIHILFTYPNLNPNWLNNGIGEIFNSDKQEHFDVGIGVGKQNGGKNNFRIEVKEDDEPLSPEQDNQTSENQNEIEFLRKLLAEKDARISELTASLERERKMNDFLMQHK